MIEIIRNKKDFINIASEWNRLAKTFENPLMRHEWFVSCVEAFYNEEDIRVIVLYSHDNIAAIAPLVLARKNLIKYLELFGISFLFEPCSLLYEDKASLFLLLAEIVKLKLPFYFKRTPANPSISASLKKLTKYRGIFVERTTSSSAYVSVNSNWEEYLNSFSSKRRYEFRLKRRRSEQYGNVQIKIFCPESEELDSYMDLAYQIEAESWKGRKRSALLYNQKLKNFFRIYTELACKEKTLRLCFFYINEKAVAVIIGLEYANRFWVLKIGYNEKWAQCSPGMQLTLETIRYAFSNGLKSYEFLGSDDLWKHDWANKWDSNVSLGFYPFSIPGLSKLTADISKYAFRKIKEF